MGSYRLGLRVQSTRVFRMLAEYRSKPSTLPTPIEKVMLRLVEPSPINCRQYMQSSSDRVDHRNGLQTCDCLRKYVWAASTAMPVHTP